MNNNITHIQNQPADYPGNNSRQPTHQKELTRVQSQRVDRFLPSLKLYGFSEDDIAKLKVLGLGSSIAQHLAQNFNTLSTLRIEPKTWMNIFHGTNVIPMITFLNNHGTTIAKDFNLNRFISLENCTSTLTKLICILKNHGRLKELAYDVEMIYQVLDRKAGSSFLDMIATDNAVFERLNFTPSDMVQLIDGITSTKDLQFIVGNTDQLLELKLTPADIIKIAPSGPGKREGFTQMLNSRKEAYANAIPVNADPVILDIGKSLASAIESLKLLGFDTAQILSVLENPSGNGILRLQETAEHTPRLYLLGFDAASIINIAKSSLRFELIQEIPVAPMAMPPENIPTGAPLYHNHFNPTTSLGKRSFDDNDNIDDDIFGTNNIFFQSSGNL